MGYKILVIDDCHTVRCLVEKSLSQHEGEFAIITAENGEQGVQKALGEPPDLILLDFMLPDMNGDEVCRRLSSEVALADVPVIFMSSDAEETGNAEGELANIESSITKPFTAEELYAAVIDALHTNEFPLSHSAGAVENGHEEEERDADQLEEEQSEVTLELCGITSIFSLISVLRGLERAQWTGALKLGASGLPQVYLYVEQGVPCLVSTPDIHEYLGLQLCQIVVPDDIFAEEQEKQAESACPCFLSLAEKDLLDDKKALHLSVEYGAKLFSMLWVAGDVSFEFYTLAELPEWLSCLSLPEVSMDAWAMGTLRLVEEGNQAMQVEDVDGVPCLTLIGYLTLQNIPLDDEEAEFVSLASEGCFSLKALAKKMELPIEKLEKLLFIFKSMEIIDYWPQSELPKEN